MREFHRTILDHIPLCIIVTDAQGRIESVNRSGLEALGRAAHAMEGQAVEGLLHGEQAQRTWLDLRERLLAAGTCTARVNLSRADGSEMVCEMHGLLSAPASSTEARVVLIFRDITAELAHAESLQEHSLELARMNSELERSNAELRRASELKSNFLSIASHELKTPLTSIKGYSDIIVDTMQQTLEPAVYGMVSSISRAADRLHRVVNNILDVTRIERGKLRLSAEDLALEPLVRECVAEQTQLSAKRGISFSCAIAPDLPRFRGDRIRMHQVLENLLSNAAKYSPDNAVVEVSVGLKGAAQFEIAVRDHGVGIAADELERVFTPFYKAGSITKHSTDAVKFMGGGPGLGLSIVKGVVERHGGSVYAESAGPQQGAFPGSTFRVLLPVRPAVRLDDDGGREPVAAGPVAPRPGSAGRGAAGGGRPLVLLADSDEEALEVARLVLEGSFEVLAAADGGSALAAAFGQHPALALLERELPVLDGLRVCQVLRGHDETAGMAVAFLSAEASAEQMQQCFECGADDYIVKPLGSRQLEDKVRQLLARRPAPQRI